MTITKNIIFVVDNKRGELKLKTDIYLVDCVSLCSKVGVMLTNRDKPFCSWHRFMHYELEIPSLFKKYCPLQTWFTFFTMVGKLPNFHI